MKRHQVREVLDDDTTLVLETHPIDDRHPDERLTLVGPDGSGTLLEVGVVETSDGLLVIHAMPARPRYRKLFDEETPR